MDGLRKEQETAFEAWLYTMGIFTCWKWVAWGFGFIVNDMIFIYNIIMVIAWFFFNIVNVFSFMCVYSLYLELNGLTKIEDMAKLKVNLFFDRELVEQLLKVTYLVVHEVAILTRGYGFKLGLCFLKNELRICSPKFWSDSNTYWKKE